MRWMQWAETLKRWVNELHSDMDGITSYQKIWLRVDDKSRCQVVETVGLVGNGDGCGRDRQWSFMVTGSLKIL